MVSLSSIFYATVAIAAVSAQSTAQVEQKAANDRYVSMASRRIVRAFTEIRSPQVDADKASSEAEHFVTALIQYPEFQKLIQNAPTDLEGKNTYSVASSYLRDVSKAYDQWSKGPSFAPYTSYFKAHITDFDVQRGIDNTRQSIQEFYPLVSEPISSFFADPQGRAIGTSAAKLGRHFVTDIGLGKYASLIPDGPPRAQPTRPEYTTYAEEDDGGCGYNNVKPDVETSTSTDCWY